MVIRTPRSMTILTGLIAIGGLLACGEETPKVTRLERKISAVCSVEVVKDGTSLGVKDVETDYVPNVINCEFGDGDFEALKAHAVASRTYVYYKLAGGATAITSGTSVQVYDCPRKKYLAQKHFDAVNATSGQILTYTGKPIWPCFNAGIDPTNPPCYPKTGVGGDTCCTNNEGKSGAQITQSPCGFVDPSNWKNRGCMCQWGAHCLSLQGKGYVEILKLFYGADIGLETVSGGSCITPVEAGVAKVDSGAAAGLEPSAVVVDGASSSGGPEGGSPLPVAGVDAQLDPGGENEMTGGCGCAVPGEDAGGSLLWLLLLGLVSAVRQRGRARTSRTSR